MTAPAAASRLRLYLGFSCCLAAILAGCKPQVPPPPPPPEVTVAVPVEREVVLYREFTGTTKSIEQVDVMARVRGFLKEQHFEDGASVDEGDPLFTIEPDEFEAQLAQRTAELEAAQADVKFAESELARANELMRRGAITQAELEIKTADRDKAKAAVNLALAAKSEAELQLSYTNVVAPISGRTGRGLPDVGSLVGPNDNALLTTIAKFDPIYAYFQLSEIELLEIMRDYRSADKTQEELEARDYPEAMLGTADTTDFSYEGKIDFVNNRVDPETGTLEVRGIFPNPAKVLVPGMFVRIRVPYRARENALLVEERALGTDLGGKYLLVLGKDNVVEQRFVTIGPRVDQLRVIDEGIQPSEQYVVVGLLRARPGLPVTPVEAESDASPPTGDDSESAEVEEETDDAAAGEAAPDNADE